MHSINLYFRDLVSGHLFKKRKDIDRLTFLLPDYVEKPELKKKVVKEVSNLRLYLQQSDIDINPMIFIAVVLTLGFIFIGFAMKFFSAIYSPIILFGYFFWIYLFLEKRAQNRAQLFSADFPTILMATASSVKAGLSPYAALERSVNLLPKNSVVKKEITDLLKRLRRGDVKKEAVAKFGQSVRLPDLELFREAFLVVMEHGGKFSPTLQRLATVCRDRSSLISSAKVSTASMRMTANVLLLVSPLVVGLVAIRTENFWDIFFNNSTANSIATLGILIIATSYAILIKMSSFKA